MIDVGKRQRPKQSSRTIRPRHHISESLCALLCGFASWRKFLNHDSLAKSPRRKRSWGSFPGRHALITSSWFPGFLRDSSRCGRAVLRGLLITSIGCIFPAAASALDHVAFRRDGKDANVSGRLVVKAEDGGLMIMSADGQLWSIQPAELIEHRADETPFAPQSADEAARAVLEQLPGGFEVYRTAHFIVCHNTSRAYAQWCGMLYERLYTGFINYWKHKGLELHEPELPLVCIIFGDQGSYIQHSRDELSDAADSIVAFYSMRTNRVTMFDLTGLESLRGASDRRGTSAQISQILARPQAARMVATVIHEATHQIAFNCGLHTRFADIPLWVSEGVAMYFEAPDLSNAKGWKTMGQVNRPRLEKLRQYSLRRPAGSLHSLIADDKRLRDPRQALEAYAEAWALNYFLILQKPKEYVAYLRALSQKNALVWDAPEERLGQFTESFGELDELEMEFVRYMRKVR